MAHKSEEKFKNSNDINDVLQENFSFSLLKENIYYGQQMVKIGSWTYDILEEKIYLSDEIYHILGCSRDEFDGKLENYYLYIHPEDFGEMGKVLQESLIGKEYDKVYRIITPSGAVKYVHEKTKTLTDENNNPIKMIGVIQDISKYKIIENELKSLSHNLTQAQRIAKLGSLKYDAVNDEISCSDEVYRIFNINPSVFKNDYRSFLNLIHPNDKLIVFKAVKECLTGKPYEIEFRIVLINGKVKYAVGKGEPLYDKDIGVVGFFGTIMDITETRELQKSIEDKQEQINKIQRCFQVLVEESCEVFGIIKPDGTILYISEAVKKVLDYNPEEQIGKNIFDFYQGKELNKLIEMVDSVLEYPNKKILEDIIYTGNGRKKIFLEFNMKNLLLEPSIQGIAISFRDITRRVKMEKRISFIANHDDLTGLPNRSYLKQKLKALCHSGKDNVRFAIMILDIDEFKFINDTLGYQIGDKLIIQINNRLKSIIKDDIFLCRYSSDQFVIIAQDYNNQDEYNGLAERIIDLFTNNYKIDMYELDININIGISTNLEDLKDVEDLIRYANIALIWAKNEGKNKYIFYSSDKDNQNYKQITLREDLRKTIEKGQLKVYYQPQVKLETSEILAAEALIRWEHPNWGIISPNEFITIAEEMGFIINIGYWLLREVCQNYKQWLKEGLPSIKISVNFSSIQFLEKNFVDNIKSTIDEFDLDPNFLIMEITESTLMKKTEKTISDIRRLQSFGIGIALDDFGTGFSSLSYLNSFNIDILKMDRSFIKNMIVDDTSTVITRYIVNMARDLNIKLIAEGIETWEQLLYLNELNCFAGQGFLFSIPMPQQEFKKILFDGKCIPRK